MDTNRTCKGHAHLTSTRSLRTAIASAFWPHMYHLGIYTHCTLCKALKDQVLDQTCTEDYAAGLCTTSGIGLHALRSSAPWRCMFLANWFFQEAASVFRLAFSGVVSRRNGPRCLYAASAPTATSIAMYFLSSGSICCASISSCKELVNSNAGLQAIYKPFCIRCHYPA